ncbi:DUF4349 domain-containing protein [Paludibacter sp.]
MSYNYQSDEMTAIPEDQVKNIDSEDEVENKNLKSEEVIDRKLIKEGRIEFETIDLKATRAMVLTATKKYNAYISSDQEYKFDNRISNMLVVRVPANKFDQLLQDATHGVTKFDNKDISVLDVTEEFLDIQARLKTKKELENRYLALLKQAKSVSDVLEIEQKMGQLRSDIESIEGRMKYIESQVQLSTLTISFYEAVPRNIAFGNKFKHGFRSGWENFILFFVGLTNIWPFIIIIGVGVWWLVSNRKKRKAKKLNNEKSQ